ncbi:hypothetical protein ACGFZA_02170 [Streptomyces sp. NPDC048211]|uniref:hypothetical protein n=1 Tax=Streptomyces sp. NPDC048211 TaxID=3365516 RepID=UPI0037147CA3
MTRRAVRGLVAAWVVLAAIGWGTTKWLGEPAATSGPASRAVPRASPTTDPAEEAERLRLWREAICADPHSDIPYPGTALRAEGHQSEVVAVACLNVGSRSNAATGP